LILTLKDFVKIFRADKVGEKIVKIIKKTILQRKFQLESGDDRIEDQL